MKKVLALAAVLCIATGAFAQVTIELLWSTTGLNGNETIGQEINFLPNWNGFTDAGPSIDFAPNAGYTGRLYLFGRISGPGVAEFDTKIIGIQIDVAGDAPADAGVAYRHRKTTGPLATRWDRWDGANPIALDGGVMAAVTSNGILALDNDAYTPNVDTYDISTGRTFLLGSVLVSGATRNQVLTAGAGALGIEVKTGSAPSFQASVVGDSVTFIPEPASLALLGLAGLLIRRR